MIHRWLLAGVRPLVDVPLARFSARAGIRHYGHRFSEVELFCLFIGYPRSGHSLLGSLINAHRHAVIAHELNVPKYVRWGFSGEQIVGLLRQRERWFERNGRRWGRYDYTVPNQWQGKVESLRVAGDKKGSATSRLLYQDTALLDRIRARIPYPMRFVHVVRNPFDNISTMYSRHQHRRSLEKTVRSYFRKCASNADLIRRIEPGAVLTVRLEDLIRRPEHELARVCEFLSLDHPDDYLRDCAGILFEKPRLTRHSVEWPEPLVAQVERRLEEFDFLSGYRYAEGA